jgi:hypothetical protein
MSALTFKLFEVSLFAGIDRDKPIIIEFPKPRKGTTKRPIVRVSGDQGLCKTSLLRCLQYLVGQKFEFLQRNLTNLDKKDQQAGIEFERNGDTWRVKISRNKFELFKFFEAGKQKGWIPQASPETLVKELIGRVAISPQSLLVDDGKKQVDWLFRMLNVPEEIVQQQHRFTDALETIGKKHSMANKEYTHLKKVLQEEPMAQHWTASEKKYAQPKTIDSEKKKVDAAQQKRESLRKGEGKVKEYDQRIADKQREIQSYKDKIAEVEAQIPQLTEKKAEWEAHNEKISDADMQYELAYAGMMELSKYIAAFQQWQQVKQWKKDRDEFETAIQTLSRQKRELLSDKRALLKKVVPDIPGLEIITDDAIEGQRTGIYLHKKNPLQLSESELFDLYFKICEAQGVTMILIENISSFGSDVIQTLNELAKKGVYIWGTEMARGQKEMSIEFVDELN